MESKEEKNLLKSVKKLIQDKDYKNAFQKCKELLSLHPSNYTGLVFLGFSAQELHKWDEAEDALKQATLIDSDQILAWKGLCTLYEKNTTNQSQIKLIDVYEKLLKLHDSDLSKQKELVDKFVSLATKANIPEKIVQANILKTRFCETDAEKFAAWKAVALNVSYLNSEPDRDSVKKNALQEGLKCDVPEQEKTSLHRELMRLYLQQASYKDAVEEAHHILHTVELDDYEALSTICQIFVKTSASIGLSPIPSDTGEVFELSELLKQSPNDSGLSLVTQGAVLLARREPWKAMTALAEGSVKCSLPHTFILLAKAQLESHCYKLAEHSSVRGLKFAPKDDKLVSGLLCLMLAKSLIMQKAKDDANLALKKCKEKLGNTNQTELCLLSLSLLGDDQDIPEQIIEKLSSSTLTKDEQTELLYLKAKFMFQMKKNFVEAHKILESSVEVAQLNAAVHLRAAIFWESKQYAQALESLVQAIKSDPYHPRNYLYLGEYYQAKENESRACQCFLKGHQLDPCDEEIAQRASDTLLNLNDYKTNRDVLLTITKNNARAQWAWLRLGISYLPAEEAVVPLQKAIRLNPMDSSAWECLGDAYLNQGSLGAALKAFGKVIELKPDSIYPIFRSAMIKKQTGYQEEAIQGFKSVLKSDSSFVPAIEGLSESCLLLAQEYLAQSLFELAKDMCFDAFHSLTEILLHEQNASCLWKLSGDLHLLLASLGPKHFPLRAEGRPTHIPDTKIALINSAIRYYGHALAVTPEISWLWQDLGCAYSQHSSQEYILKAAACYRQALTLNPLVAAHWLAFGALITQHMEFFDSNLAQHCYIQALHLEPTNAICWSGLGFLYLEAGEVELAHQAFSRAQDTEPDLANAWIGQAMVATRISPDDVLDLYWHATTLSNHSSGLLGYGYSVCSALLNADEGFASQKEKRQHITNATDCLIHVTANDETSGPTLNALGLLLERQNMLQLAVDSFQKSLQVLPASFKESVRVNLARALRCQGKGSEALNVLAQISGSGDPETLCEMALAHWSIKNWEQALKAYQVSLQKCTPDMKSHILVAMAMVTKKLKQENTVQLLLESYKHRPMSVAGLVAIAAEGFLLNVPRLVEVSLNELQKFRIDPDHASHVAHLMTLREIKKDNLRGAIRQMSAAVHRFPSKASLWTRLSRLLIEEELQTFSSNGLSQAMRCAQTASKLLRSNQEPISHKNIDLLPSLLIKVAAAQVEGKTEEALSAAKAAAHLCPGDAASWSCLLASLMAKNKWNDSVFHHSLIEESDPLQLDWLHCCHAYHHLSNGRPDHARKALEKIPGGKSASSMFLQSAMSSLQDVEAYLEKNPRNTMAWRLLVRRLVEMGDYQKAEQVIRNWIKVVNPQMTSLILTPLLTLSLVAWEAAEKTDGKNSDSKNWLSRGEESVNAVLQKTRKCALAFFIAVQFARAKGNTKFEKKFLNQCLELAGPDDKSFIQQRCSELTKVEVLKDPFGT